MIWLRLFFIALVSFGICGCTFPLSPLMFLMLKNEDSQIYFEEPQMNVLPDEQDMLEVYPDENPNTRKIANQKLNA